MPPTAWICLLTTDWFGYLNRITAPSNEKGAHMNKEKQNVGSVWLSGDCCPLVCFGFLWVLQFPVQSRLEWKKKLQIAGRCVWVWMLVLIFVLGVPHLSLCVSCLASSEALHRISGYSWWMNSNLSVRMCVDTRFILDYAMFTPVIVSVGNDGSTRWSNSHPSHPSTRLSSVCL